ncbi:MAG: Na+/H+ antiporter subunit C [Anaerolineae bacterium]|nr:Na+/H+ antiporter subunit C [Anaerolineae bacterium]
MEVVLALVIGGLYAAGLYMMMRRSFVKLVIGLALLGYAANLLIFTVNGLTRGAPPLVPEGATRPAEPFADPLPQALILTAIVIGFGVQAFTLVLFKRTYQAANTDDLDRIRSTEQPGKPSSPVSSIAKESG